MPLTAYLNCIAATGEKIMDIWKYSQNSDEIGLDFFFFRNDH